MIEELNFPSGCRLLSRWQAGDPSAKDRLREVFDAAIQGQFDRSFTTPPPPDKVHAGGSLNLMTLSIMHDLFGHDSAEFYKGDAARYVRTTLFSRRLLGMEKLYLSWPVYGFTAEALGQAMMYPDKFPPGSDPEKVLVNRDTWQDIRTPDLNTGIPKLIEEMLTVYQHLTGMEPILHLSAPYSLAADIFGQEPLLDALVNAPDFANEFLDHLADHVLLPWIDHFFTKFPNGWVELSDASGSPFFIGPLNCRDMAIQSIQRIIEATPKGHRIYDANYRGDYVTQAEKPVGRPSRRRAQKTPDAGQIDLLQLTDLKHSVCRDFVIRLDDDRVPVSFYQEQAIARQVPLLTGIGASQIDRNSVEDMAQAKLTIRDTAENYVSAIKTVAETLAQNGISNRALPWPGAVYFEDISSESSFEMIEIIIGTVLENGALTL